MIDTRRVDQASRMAARWLAKSCQMLDPADAALGAFATGYDFDKARPIFGPEVWHTAEAIRALLRIHARTRNQAWKDSALLGGRYLASVQVMEGEHTGSLWYPWLDAEGLALRVDSNYRSIVGLLDLYGATGSMQYLEVSKGIASWFMSEAYKGGGTHLNRYLVEKRVLGWPRSHILDEGAFLKLHDLTREESYSAVHGDQVQAIASSCDSSGLFTCMTTPRMERDPELEEGSVSSRSMYWHIIPLIMACEKRANEGLLESADRAAERMLGLQDSDGFLVKAYDLEGEPSGDGGPDGVATAMFALAWIKLLQITGKESFGQGAELALSWMLESQTVARRNGFLGAFFQERVSRGGRIQRQPGSLGSSYGVLACEEYLKTASK
jgi:hypothetical protein